MNLRQKYYVYLFVSLLLSLLAVGISFSLGAAMRTQAAQPEPDTLAASQTEAVIPAQEAQTAFITPGTAEIPPPLYTVRAVGDEVRVIPHGNEAAYRILPGIDLRTLRQVDSAALRTGILLYTEEELAAFLEDFGS